MKKSVLITLVAIVLVTFVVLFAVIASKGGEKKLGGSSSGADLTPQQRGDIVKEHHLELSKKDTRFNGVVGSVTTPKGVNVKILEIEGFIDDFEALRNMSPEDFAGDSVEVPTMKKTFKVAIDENTKLIGFKDLGDIKSGDQVMIDAGQDPKKVEEFTAIEISLNFRVQ
ncbi:hypothetical protein HN784_04870 [bacterium]|jgi:hypothetical protein|nr:hypothetical protein [bacterium]MBT4251507.1 hypothetical protein [bacterium]MBT4597481.1 hypothetical protein [bacterium]MBT6754320.1 hypothetical protein [bacterium]MBT7037646.1 hypothetical protein [bacterium]